MKHTKSKNKRKISFLSSVSEDVQIKWLILLGTTMLVTLLLFPSLWRFTPEYRIGDVAEKNIKSPKSFLVEDKEATQKRREEAALSVLTLYDFDDGLAAKLEAKVIKAFDHMQTMLSEQKNETIETPKDVSALNQANISEDQSGAPLSLHDLIWQEKPVFEAMLGVEISNGAYELLEKESFSMSIARGITELLRTVYQRGIVGQKQLLQPEQQNGIIIRPLSSKQEIHEKDLKKFLSLDGANVALADAGKAQLKNVDYSVRKLIIDLAQSLVQPNLTLNKGETEERRARAADQVKAVLTQIKKGEMLVREGEKISALHMAKLNTLQSEMQKKPVFTISIGFILLSIIFLLISFTINFGANTGLSLKNNDLLFLCVMLVILFVVSEVSVYLVKGIAVNIPYAIETSSAFYAMPIASGAMTVCLFLGLTVALPYAIATAFVTAFLFENQFDMFLFILLSSMVGAYLVRSCRERGVLIKAGLKVSIVNVAVITALHMLRGSALELKLVWDWVFGILGGVTSGILTTGFAPVVEMVFGYTTDVKLLELGNLDRPVLRQLMLEAPGTYHHSVIVGSLVEAAAPPVGANPLLAKVSGYYHDIGKTSKPQYFIENQAPGKNRHDKLAPSMSSLILLSHVKDGVERAKRHKLGTAITDIIQQHHGTGLISFFYEKAKQMKGRDAVKIENFRYPGPKPQTKEAGLVLLADGVEAASRTLENPTPRRMKALVQNIINRVLLDGQLDECDLTLKEIHAIAESFNKTLNGIYHHRIEYPNGRDGKTESSAGKTNGHSHRGQTEAPQHRQNSDKEKGDNHPGSLGNARY
jgi:cyclic-di-AMP phosphodiesterase PgpH